MAWRLLLHEWRALRADSALWLVVAVFALSIGYGTFNGARWAAFMSDAIVEARAEEADRIRRHEAEISRISREGARVSAFADPRNPGTVGRGLGSRYAVLPPTALATLAVGQSDLLPSYVRMTTDAKETVFAATELENPHRLLAGRFDLAFVLIYLYPLLILALTYNLLSAEREQGTLVLALSQPVSLRTFVLAKIALRFAAFLSAIVLLAVIALVIGNVDLGAAGAPPRLALWMAAVIAYGAFWFAVAVLVTAAGKNSSTNAMMLAGVWLVLVVFVPSMLNLTARTVYPVPSRVEMIQAMRMASDEANEQGSKLLARYYEDHPELASGDAQQAMNDFNLVRVAVGAEVERAVAPVLDRYTEQLDGQHRIVARARFLSPAILMQNALSDVAGTGAARHRAFMGQVEAYHQQWRDYFARLIFDKGQLRDYSDLPRFSWHEETVGAVASRVIVSLVGMLVPALAIAALGFFGLRRYPITG
jgi:ABC-2 type transport system permease protein